MNDRITNRPLEWEATAARLAPLGAWVQPSELHGLLCGSVCAGDSGLDDAGWLARIAEHAGEDVAAAIDPKDLLWLRNRALVNLGDVDLAFDLLLPEEQPLGERLAALGAWCSGFLSGFGLGGGQSDHFDEDASSGLADLVAISELDRDSADESDVDAEASYAELVEYVRVVVLLILQHRLASEGRGGSS